MSIKSFLGSVKPNPKTLKSDAISGFATGLFSIPEGMAYAQLAGVNPLYGMYSGIVATIAASLSTGTILMIATVSAVCVDHHGPGHCIFAASGPIVATLSSELLQ